MGLGEARSSSKKRLTSNGSKTTTSGKGKTKSKSNQAQKGNCLRIISSILTRVLFALHTGVALWRVHFDYPKEYLYFLSIGLALLLFEMVFAIGVRRGKEYKWFCPSVLFYLMSVVPCLWLLELARFKAVTTTATELGICNVTGAPSQLLETIFKEKSANTSVSNRTRRDVPNMELLIDAENTLRLSEKLFGRIKRQTTEDELPKSERKRRRRRRKKQKSTESTLTTVADATVAGKSVNGESTITDDTENSTAVSEKNSAMTTSTSMSSSLTSQLLTTTTTSGTISTSSVTSQSPVTAILGTTTSSTTSQSMTSQQPTQDGDGIRLDNLGDKIKEGFSSFEKETANIYNKTVEVIGRLNRVVDPGTWILLLHQVLLFVLVIGRWLLPKGEITRDQLSQLLLVFIGVGADILEFVTETIDGDELDPTSCSMMLHFVIYAVWSWSLLQFTLVLTASKSRKTRVGFEEQYVVNTTNKTGCCGNSLFASADLWGILVTLFLQDVPFLATRLYILIVYNLKHQMMIFFTGKNALVVILQIYRIVVLKLSRKNAKEDAVDEVEMEPLRGTLHQLARRATMVSDNGGGIGSDEVRDATFKRERDGSVIVKIHLEGEETLKKKRKKSAERSAR